MTKQQLHPVSCVREMVKTWVVSTALSALFFAAKVRAHGSAADVLASEGSRTPCAADIVVQHPDNFDSYVLARLGVAVQGIFGKH